MPEFTRLTIIGTERKAELVVPSDEAIGRLMPRLMELLEEPNGSVARPLTLVRATGEQLDVAHDRRRPVSCWTVSCCGSSGPTTHRRHPRSPTSPMCSASRSGTARACGPDRGAR